MCCGVSTSIVSNKFAISLYSNRVQWKRQSIEELVGLIGLA